MATHYYYYFLLLGCFLLFLQFLISLKTFSLCNLGKTSTEKTQGTWGLSLEIRIAQFQKYKEILLLRSSRTQAGVGTWSNITIKVYLLLASTRSHFAKVVLVLFGKEKTWRVSDNSLPDPRGFPGPNSRGQVSVPDTRDAFLLKERKNIQMFRAVSSRNGQPQRGKKPSRGWKDGLCRMMEKDFQSWLGEWTWLCKVHWPYSSRMCSAHNIEKEKGRKEEFSRSRGLRQALEGKWSVVLRKDRL